MNQDMNSSTSEFPTETMTREAAFLWQKYISKSSFSTNDIHIWRLSLEALSFLKPHLERFLAPDERERSARFIFDKDRKRYIIGRGALRIILGSYLKIQPEKIRFVYGLYGKPMLYTKNLRSIVHFNLSHSNNMALVAIARDAEIGVDIEYVRPLPDAEEIAERFFSTEEFAAFRSIPPAKKLNAFYKCWTRKESFIKAIGNGLSQSLHSFQVSLAPGEPARLISIDNDKKKAAEWTIWDLMPSEGYAAAFAVKLKDLKLTCIDHKEFFQFCISNNL
jgi:4'-phosphopantetheinyl transferase